MDSRIKVLEELVKRTKGELEVIIRRNTNDTILSNGSETNFVVELEDYLEKYTATDAETGRVYSNNIYVIKDFVLITRNKSLENPLGLLSSRKYDTTNSDVYNAAAPQVFWVDQNAQLLVSNSTGVSKTQLDNQFIWCVNYDKVNENSVIKLGQNIANNFADDGINSLVDILSSTQFNLGYSENEVLTFVGNNLSIFDSAKWIEKTEPTSSSDGKLLSTIHPQIQSFDKIQETNSDKLKTINGGTNNEIIIPINIYFKMNSLDPTQFRSVNLNKATTNVQHKKKLKFFFENFSDNRPFVVTLNFTLNRVNLITRKSVPTTPLNTN
jgi:hypothetical protein